VSTTRTDDVERRVVRNMALFREDRVEMEMQMPEDGGNTAKEETRIDVVMCGQRPVCSMECMECVRRGRRAQGCGVDSGG
jgi:hypothetical protein